MSLPSLHFDALTARLLSDPRLAGKVFDTTVNSDGTVRTGEYLVLFGGNPDQVTSGRFNAPQMPDSDAVYRYTLRGVGGSKDAARDMCAAGFALLVGFQPVIAGRNCSRIRHDGADPIDRDPNESIPLWFGDDDYVLNSYKA
ncbi:MAG: hypothetical protein EPO52_17645 [Herbiconiux sp.]|uniref:hypothetical protein n=1 Tax=Herbiconiux sp. TaxID=1871186 RepID=UPI0012256E85|nr:hypothetical protein [Herbiconiux sp.]TAJ46357.1 MAG: hypothetical protein EPO52_17645 [Herbiconiux sp.]